MLSVLCQFTATVASGSFILKGEAPTYYRENINIQGISIRVRKGLLSITASWVEWKKGKKKRAWRDEAKHRWYHEWGSGETQPNQEKHIFKENIMPIVVKLRAKQQPAKLLYVILDNHAKLKYFYKFKNKEIFSLSSRVCLQIICM